MKWALRRGGGHGMGCREGWRARNGLQGGAEGTGWAAWRGHGHGSNGLQGGAEGTGWAADRDHGHGMNGLRGRDGRHGNDGKQPTTPRKSWVKEERSGYTNADGSRRLRNLGRVRPRLRFCVV